MADKTIVLITGANTGLGLEIVKKLVQSKIEKPYHVLVGSRSIEKGHDAIALVQKENPESTSTMEVIQIDVTSDESIQACFETIQKSHGHLDVLVNNAGANFDFAINSATYPGSTRDAWNKSWDVNVTGTQILTTALMPLLFASPSPTPRLLFVTSGMASTSRLAERTTLSQAAITTFPAGWPKPAGGPPLAHSYMSAKAGLNMMFVGWYRLLESDKVKVFCVSPGLLATGLGGIGAENLRKRGAEEPEVGGERVMSVIEGGRDADEGKVLFKDGVQPW